jgi:hypothetical protein
MNYFASVLKFPLFIIFAISWSFSTPIQQTTTTNSIIKAESEASLKASLTPMLVIYHPGTSESTKVKVRNKFSKNKYVLYQFHEKCDDYEDKEIWYIAYTGPKHRKPGPKSETESDDDVKKAYVDVKDCDIK